MLLIKIFQGDEWEWIFDEWNLDAILRDCGSVDNDQFGFFKLIVGWNFLSQHYYINSFKYENPEHFAFKAVLVCNTDSMLLDNQIMFWTLKSC